jgi:O-antigen/teichoic acid export membrane protein
MILFGLKFQAPDLIVAARDQGLNLAIASFGGLTLLGLWSLAARVLAAPVVLLSVLWRVSFPAMARLATAGHDGRLEMERGAGLAAYAAALLLVPIAGSAPLLIDTVFGHRWHEAAGVLPVICFGLQIEGPLSVCSFGFLSAAGAAGAVARIGIGAAAASLVTAIPLIPPLGLLGIGIGYVVGSVVGVILMWRAVRRRLDVRLAGAIARPTLAGTVVSGGAWLVARRLDADLPTLLLLVMTSLAALVILMRLLAAQTARDARVAVRRAIAQARSGARVSNGHTAAP